ncbi:MAG: TIGR03618 family F420-dependent PPOX class oxidoreductase [Streptosporangiales bacterium]|nr:TIGR03618 family F420-dependent PPOX class oxidoreductase [Streptosporangiales bacterium]
MSAVLPDAAKEWFDGANFATISTIEPDGRPQASMVWVGRDGDDVLVSTTRQRRKAANMGRDSRVSLLMANPEDPYSYIEIRGTASVIPDPTSSLINELSNKYIGKDYPWDPPDAERVIIRISADKVVFNASG